MNRKKPLTRLLAALLSLALTFGLTPLTAVAAGETFTQGNLTFSVISDPVGASPGAVSVKAMNNSISGELTIPASVNYNGHTYAVTEIAAAAFSGCSGLSGDLTIPGSVTNIGNNAFHNCTDLTSLTLNEGLQTIGQQAFDGCTSLSGGLTVPSSVSSIGSNAFRGCTGFNGTLTILAETPTIGMYAFSGCTGFTGIASAISSFAAINSNAFYGLKNIPVTCAADYVQAHRTYGFTWINGGSAGTTFTIDDLTYTVLTAPVGASPGAVSVKATDRSTISGPLTIPASVNYNGSAFTVTAIAATAFYECSGLNGDLTIPGSVTTIGENTFYKCTNLTSLTLNEGLQTIGYQAFYGCTSLSGGLTVPGSVSGIGSSAFSGCSNFNGTLTILAETPIIDYYAFGNCTGFTDIASAISSFDSSRIDSAAFRGLESKTVTCAAAIEPAHKTYGFINVTVATAPVDPPQSFSATPGKTMVTLSWAAPSNTGGSPVVGYKVSANGTDWTTLRVVTAYTFTGLTGNTPYTFRVKAYNVVGDGPEATFEATTEPKTIVNDNITFNQPASKTYTGSEQTPDLTAGNPSLNGVTAAGTPVWTYSYAVDTGVSSNNAALGANGLPLAAGRYIVTAAYEDDDNIGSATTSFVIDKVVSAAPAAPTASTQNITATSVTLDAITGAEYRLSTAEDGWQDSLEFTGLTPNTDYTFYARLKETATHSASPESALSAAITTNKSTLTGAVTISGSTLYGQTLTAVTSGLSSDPSAALGDLSYQWKRGGNDIAGANSATYTLVQEDIGQTVTVAVTAANCTGEVTSDPTAAIAKAEGPAAPAAVTGSYTGDGTTFTYTVTPITGAEYSQDGSTWQDSNIFTGFTTSSPATTFYARLKETATHEAGAAGNTGEVNFLKLSGRAAPPLAYSVSDGDFPKTVTITSVTGAEYSFNDAADAAYSQTDTYDSAGAEDITLYIRLAETATHNASPSSSVVINTAYQNQAAPAAFTLFYLSVNDQTYTVTIPATEGAEYSFDGTNWGSDNVKTGCLPNETVTGYKRLAAQEGYNPSPAVSDSVTLPLFKVKTPTASPANRNFTSSVSVTLSSDTPDASIYYTIDSSEPTIAATLYSGEFTLSATTTIKALAVKAGMTDSDVLTVTFTKSSGSSIGDSGGDGGGSGGGGAATQPTVKEDESKKEGTTGNLQGIDPKATKPVQLKTEDGIQIIIQPGALSQWTNPVDFSVAVGTITTSPQAAANVVILNPANYQRQFEVEGEPQGQAEFNAPVTLIFPIKVAELPEGVTLDQLAVYLWDAERQDWLKLGGVYNEATQTLSVNVWHFSTYAVMADTSPAPNRLAGYDRFATANAIADQGWSSGADNVVLVNAYSFPDALAAGPLAYKLNAPILLTDAASLTPATQAQLQKLGAKKITLIGGTAVVSQAIQDALSATYGEANVVRYSGIDRYATAAEIAKALGATGQAVIANGEDGLYTDALAVSSYAAYNGIPILFTEAAKLPEATAQALTDRNVKSTIVVGGAAVVPEAVYNQLPGATRYAGYDCYETATAIATGLKLNLSRVYVVSGLNFPDALVAGNLASHTLAPIIMVDRALPTATGSFLNTNQGAIKGLTIVGGEGIITAAQEEAVRGALQK